MKSHHQTSITFRTETPLDLIAEPPPVEPISRPVLVVMIQSGMLMELSEIVLAYAKSDLVRTSQLPRPERRDLQLR